MTRIERQKFTATILALTIVTRQALGSFTEAPECSYIYPVGEWLEGQEGGCTPMADDPDGDEKVIETSVIDLRGSP